MIKKMEIPTTAFGLNPFTTTIIRTLVKPTADSKVGVSTSVWLNQETGVQVAYIHSRVKFYDMSNPADSKEYWGNRARVKAAFCRSMGWRK
jgi:hypothetical protein